jgi:uncharacterized protein (TIGR03086 family)
MDQLQELETATEAFGRRLRAAPDDGWDAVTPCDGWTARDLVQHVCWGSRMSALVLGGATRDEAVAVPAADLGDDLVGAYQRPADEQLAAFRQPGALDRVVQHPVMDMPGSMLRVLRVAELTLHAWDLARATGGDEELPPALVGSLWGQLEPIGPLLAGSGMYGEGPSGSLGDGAPLQARLLDLSGRRP